MGTLWRRSRGVRWWASSGKELVVAEGGPLPLEVAGVELEKHVLPFNNHKISCDPAQIGE